MSEQAIVDGCRPEPSPAVAALPNGIRQPKRRAFLAAFAQTGNISEAARIAGVNRLSHYEWLHDERYAEVFAQAQEIAGDYLEAVAFDRATNGWFEPVFYQGQQVGVILKKSDQLLMFLLKAHRPDKFRDNATIQHTGPGGGAIKVEADYELSRKFMDDPDLLAQAELLAALAYEDRTAGELPAGPAPIPANSEEVIDDA
ncbi:MAG: hypothetical protein LC798_17030 [Chloroflexi bacterium]|nr:hypothetical protein [Chloroflexota bacterium]